MSKRLYTPLHICQNMHYLDEMPKPTSTTPMNDKETQGAIEYTKAKHSYLHF